MEQYKKESLKKLLTLVDEIANTSGNEWFQEELISKYSRNKTPLETYSNDYLVKSEETFHNTEKIKKYLNLSPKLSIDYTYIPIPVLKTRLELDNLRMENVRIDLKEKDELKRLYDYIVYAFYQVENLINFYFYYKYPEIESLLDHLESIESEHFSFKRNREENIGDINIWVKLTAFTTGHFNGSEKHIAMSLNNLRKVRNESVHRCSAILKTYHQENKALYHFLKKSNYNSILSILKKLSNKIESLTM